MITMASQSTTTEESSSTDVSMFTRLFYFAVFLYMGALLVQSWNWDWDNKLFPILVGVPTILLAGSMILPARQIDVVNTLLTKVGGDSTDETEDMEITEEELQRAQSNKETRQIRTELAVFGWTVLLPISVYLFGYYITIPLYTFAFVWYFYRDVKYAATITVLFSMFVFVIFVLVFQVILWPGALGLPNPVYYL